MKAVYIEQTGGPEAMRLGDRPVPELQKDEVLVKVIGVDSKTGKIKLSRKEAMNEKIEDYRGAAVSA